MPLVVLNFPRFEFVEHDILSGPLYKKYAAVICLSLIYLFNEEKLLAFFRNVSDSLKIGGRLILDSAGSPNNLLFYLIHDVLLKYEILGIRPIKFLLTGRLNGFVTKHHGYRRTDEEIIKTAKQSGFELLHHENYAFTIQFKRSYLLNKAIKPNSILEKTFKIIGKSIPYIRISDFRKVI